MPTHSSSHRAIALMVVFVLYVITFSDAATAPQEPAISPLSQRSPKGYSLEGEQQVSTPLTPTDPDRFRPDSAYDSQNRRFLVVWHQTYQSGHDREVYGQLVNRDGSKYGSPIIISSGTNDRTLPAVAYNATDHEFLVVYMYDVNGDGQKYDIRGQRIDENGALIGSYIPEVTDTNRTFWSPRIAWNLQRNEYMLVFTEMAQDTQIALYIVMHILNGVGIGQTAGFVTTTGFPTNPDVTFDPVNQNYLVVWNYVNTSGVNAIEAELRNSIGDDVRSIPVYGSTMHDSLYPRVTSSLGIFFTVVWEYEIVVNDHDIYNALVTSDATTVLPAPLVEGDTNDTSPDVAGSSDQYEYMVTYQRADANGSKVFMSPISKSLPKENIEVCNYVFTNCMLPSIEFGGATFLNTYVIQLSTNRPGTGQPSATVQHIFDRPFNTLAGFLPLILR
jgi:hypothetical protein